MHALVTGSSTGIGRATAVHLAREGWRVFATVRDPAARAALERDLGDAGTVLEMDVRSDASVEQAVKEMLAATGERIDALVNNAGVNVIGACEEVPLDAAEAVFATNVIGTMRVTQAVLPAMRRAGSGRIVVISSILGRVALPGFGVYAATKWALEGWVETLAHELPPHGIAVTALAPGPYRSELNRRAATFVPERTAYPEVAGFLRGFHATRIEGRARDPQEVARAVHRVLTERRPKIRRTVGPDARRLGHVKQMVPLRSLIRGIRRASARTAARGVRL